MSAAKPVESEPAKNAYGYGTAHANGATRICTPPIDEGEKKQPFRRGPSLPPPERQELVAAMVRGRVKGKDRP
jgi:hypothetical protein